MFHRRTPLSLLCSLLVAAPLVSGAPASRDRVQSAIQQFRSLRADLGLDERNDFRALRSLEDELGQTHVRMQQIYQSVKVWGGEAILHLDAEGTALRPTLAHKRDIYLNVLPSMAEAEALAVVQMDLAPRAAFAGKPTVELVVYPEMVRVRRGPAKGSAGFAVGGNAMDFTEQVQGYRLAYHIHTEIESPGDTRHTDYLVNAHTGAVIEKWDSLQTANAVGTGNSQYSGTVQLNAKALASGYELRDLTRSVGAGNTANDMNHSTSGTGTVYTDADNVWGDGQNYKEAPEPTTSPNGQTVAVDAAFGIQATWDMYKNILGRIGIDGQGGSVYARVHYDNGYDNAFYSDTCHCLTYGDGTKRLPYTALDIAGHEYSHGVCSATAGLIYSKESGGLNESNSDIFGVMTEFYVRGANGQGSVIPDTGGNWTQGEQIATPASPLYRIMYKPSLDTKSADEWSPTLSTLDVHYSSGPMNRCFYFMSQGATTSGNTSTPRLPQGMTGMGNQKAAKVWYRALTTYMTSSTDYAAARIACIQAVRDLYPLSGPEEIAVWNAFAGINVGGPWAGADAPPTVSVSESGSKGTLTFSATASDDKGVVKVDFLLDGAAVGTVTSPPYTMTFDSTLQDDGAHTLVARATDTAGLFTNATLPLTIANGQLIKNASFEKGYGVGWSNTSGMQIGAILNTPAYDGTKCAKFCGSGSSMSVALFQDVTIPATVTSASLSYALHIETKETSGTAHDTFAVQIRDATGVLLGTLATYSNLNAAPGYTVYSNNLSAYKGQTIRVYFLGTEDSSVSTGFVLDKVNLLVDGAGPVDTQAPTASASESGASGTITFNATASDNVGVTKVEFYVDGLLKGTDTATPFSMTLDSATLANGSHALVAKAYDTAGNVGTSTSVSFSVNNTTPDTQAPAVSATEIGASGIISFNATATDNVGVTKVEFYVDGLLKGTDTTTPFSLTLDSATLANGSHALVAKAYDAAGNVGASTSFSFSVNNTTPPPTTYIEVESNDSMATANIVGDAVTTIVAYISTSTDQDFFQIKVASGRTLMVNMTGPARDYDLYLLSASGSTLKSSAGSASTESVAYTNTSGATATYYLKVVGFGGAFLTTTPYNLALSR